MTHPVNSLGFFERFKRWLNRRTTPAHSPAAISPDLAVVMQDGMVIISPELRAPEPPAPVAPLATQSRTQLATAVLDSRATRSLDAPAAATVAMPEAVQQDGHAVTRSLVAESAQAACLAAVRQRGNAIEHFSAAERTPAVCLEAVRETGHAIRHLTAEQRTPEVCLAAVRRDGAAVKYINGAQRTAEVCVAAVQRHGPAIALIPAYVLDEPGAELFVKWVAENWTTVSPHLGSREAAYSTKLVEAGFELTDPTLTDPTLPGIGRAKDTKDRDISKAVRTANSAAGASVLH